MSVTFPTDAWFYYTGYSHLNEPLTMAAWFYQTVAANHAICGIATNASGNHRHTLTFNGGTTSLLLAQSRDTGTSGAATSNTGTQNVWQHACGIYTLDNDRIGVLDGDWANRGINTTSRAVAGSDILCIGARENSSTQDFIGSICEFAVWSAALNQYEVEALYAGYSPALIRPSSLVYYVPAIRDFTDRIQQLTQTVGGAGGGGSVGDHARIIYPAPRIIPFNPVPLSVTVSTTIQKGQTRGVEDTSTDENNPTDINGADVSLEIGTAITKDVISIFNFDLTGIPFDTHIIKTTFDLNILSVSVFGTSAEMELEIMRLPEGLDLDFDTLSDEYYDGINLWPLKRYDRSLRIISQMPSSTGSFTFNADFTPFIREALRNKESKLTLAIQRTQKTAAHKLMSFDSSESATQAFKPKLTITHTIQVPPATIIKGSRLHVVKKWATA